MKLLTWTSWEFAVQFSSFSKAVNKPGQAPALIKERSRKTGVCSAQKVIVVGSFEIIAKKKIAVVSHCPEHNVSKD